MLACLPLGAQLRPAAKSALGKRFVLAVDRTLREGVQAKLPPHISTLLGLTQEQECPVRQAIVRTGTTVKGIDVSIADKNDIVLFVVDETAKDQTLLLTSPQGSLRKLVSVKAGVGAVSRITEKDRKAFEAEKRFWADRLARTTAPK